MKIAVGSENSKMCTVFHIDDFLRWYDDKMNPYNQNKILIHGNPVVKKHIDDWKDRDDVLFFPTFDDINPDQLEILRL